MAMRRMYSAIKFPLFPKGRIRLWFPCAIFNSFAVFIYDISEHCSIFIIPNGAKNQWA